MEVDFLKDSCDKLGVSIPEDELDREKDLEVSKRAHCWQFSFELRPQAEAEICLFKMLMQAMDRIYME